MVRTDADLIEGTPIAKNSSIYIGRPNEWVKNIFCESNLTFERRRGFVVHASTKIMSLGKLPYFRLLTNKLQITILYSAIKLRRWLRMTGFARTYFFAKQLTSPRFYSSLGTRSYLPFLARRAAANFNRRRGASVRLPGATKK